MNSTILQYTQFVYNMKPVTVTLKDQLPLLDSYHMENEIIKLPLWYAKNLKKMEICEIKDYLTFEKRFNQYIADQKLNKYSLVNVGRDFYLEFFDYISFLSNKRKKVKKDMINKLRNFRLQRESIIIKACEFLRNKSIINNMSFEEGLFYSNILQSKNSSYSQINNLLEFTTNKDEEEEEEGM